MNPSYLGFCCFSAAIESYQNTTDHTNYIIKVTASPHYSVTGLSRQSWTVSKRFSDFDKLHQKLRVYDQSLPLPQKTVFRRQSPEFVIERQAGLQRYLDCILSDPLLCHSAPVVEFLYAQYPTLLEDFQTHATQFVSMEFRSGSQWELVEPVPECGYRGNKSYFLAKKRENQKDTYCVTWHEFLRFPVVDMKEMSKTVASFTTVRHPFIHPIEHAVCNERGVLFVRPFSRLGSLADGMNQMKPAQACLKKYSTSNASGLTMQAIRIFGKQILVALAFLHARNWCHGHLTIRNVILTSASTVALTDVENFIFSYHPMVWPHLVDIRKQWTLEEVDIYCFGRCLLEMASGKPVHKAVWDPEDLPKSHELRTVLQILLTRDAIKGKLPSAETLMQHEFFSSVRLPSETGTWRITPICRQLMTARLEQIRNELQRDQQLLRATMRLALAEDRAAEEKCNRKLEYRRHTTALGRTAVSAVSTPATRNSVSPGMIRTDSMVSTGSVVTPQLRVAQPSTGDGLKPEPLPRSPPQLNGNAKDTLRSPSKICTSSAPFLGSVTAFDKSTLRKAVTNDRSAPAV